MLANGTARVNLRDLLVPATIRLGVSATDKLDLIKRLVRSLEGHDIVSDLSVVEQDVLDRERLLSTAVGNGIALPHAKTAGVSDSAVVLATLPEPVLFEAVDGQPVDIVFLVVSPINASSQQVRILGRLSRLLHLDDFRENLLATESPDQVMDIIKQAEADLLAA